MKILKKYFIMLLAAVGFLTPVFAQHRDNRGFGDQNRNSNSRQTFSSPRQGNAFVDRQTNSSPRSGNSFINRQTNSTPRPGNSFIGRQDLQTPSIQPRQRIQLYNRGGGNTSPSNFRTRVPDNNNVFVQRNNRLNQQSNSTSWNNPFRNDRNFRYGYGQRGYSSSGYRDYRYDYSPRPYSYSGYRHYSILPRSFISISFGGYPYYYNSGLFYSYYNGFYEPVYAPFGICVSDLPYGYYPFYMGPTPYYYYDGVYYRNHGDNEYEVVDAPMGAVVSALPKGAKAVTVNGEKFYEFNGTYYKEGTNDKNEVVYSVVGKYGEINNSDDPGDVSSNQPLKMGDIISTLPDNSRPVTINGESLFVSPDNFYFKQRTDNGVTSYEVVGTAAQN